MRGTKKFLVFSLQFLVVCSLFSFIIPMAHAQTPTPSGVNLTTSPLPISLSVVPGSSVSTDIRVKNDSSSSQKLKVSLMKFKAFGEEGKPALIDRQPGDDYFDWVHFSRNNFNADPNQWETIKMTIATPKAAAFGYYYAVVFSRADDFTPTGKGNKLLGSTAVLVLLDVKSPNAKRSAKILDFSADRKMYEFLPATFTVRFRNDGNTHVLPHGNVFIKRGSKQVATLVLNAQQGNILPGSNRIYNTAWKDGWPVYIDKEENGRVIVNENGKPVQTLKWDLTKIPKLKFGHYTAQLVAVYDDGKQDVPLEASLSFWVIPWRVIIYGLAIPIIPAVLVYLLMKRRLNKKLATSKKVKHEKK